MDFFIGSQPYVEPLKSKPQPTDRFDALQLAQSLEQALPVGAIAAKYKAVALGTGEAAKLYPKLLHIRSDFQVVDVTLRESARLVAANCSQQANVLEKVPSLA